LQIILLAQHVSGTVILMMGIMVPETC
jgi:hypothetical protein